MTDTKDVEQYVQPVNDVAVVPKVKAHSSTSILSLPLTDLGNAQRLIRLHGKNLRRVGDTWFVWDRTHWTDKTAESHVQELAINTVQTIGAEIVVLETSTKGALDEKFVEKTLRPLQKWSMHSQSISRINAMIKLATSNPEVRVDPERLDTDPYLFNLLNGTLDLQTGQIVSHNRDHLITKLTPFSYESGAVCPLWEKFLVDVFASHTELIPYIQKLLGYSQSGDMSEAVFPILYGTGGNGKTTLVEVVHHVMGKDYSVVTHPETLLARRTGAMSNDIAALSGKRFVVSSETNRGARLNEALIKQMTGGSTVSARFMYKEFAEIAPRFKIFVDTNHLPRFRDDQAMGRRLVIIPFESNFENRDDKTLRSRLHAEAPGILKWLGDGFRTWRREGLKAPAIVLQTTTTHREAMDPTGEYLTTQCELSSLMSVRADELLKGYLKWCDDFGKQADDADTFYKQAHRITGVEVKRIGRAAVTVYVGIKPLNIPTTVLPKGKLSIPPHVAELLK
jgi:putative DNA primase/helicase